ncbi:MAG: hypothetical protein AAF936_12940 [Pseudomonadota bacterium]
MLRLPTLAAVLGASFLLTGTANAGDYRCANVNKWAPKAYAEQFVKERLKNPRKAQFSGNRATREGEIERCVFIVAGWVESTNGFGATVRSDYAVKLRRRSNRWEALEVAIE